jgi:hypothetical protein
MMLATAIPACIVLEQRNATIKIATEEPFGQCMQDDLEVVAAGWIDIVWRRVPRFLTRKS